jgi:two-component system response regulator NreC
VIPRILLVDDHGLVRQGIAALLDDSWNICGEAEDGQEAIERVIELKPDLVLLDLSMPRMGGTAAARQIRQVSPTTKIVFLSMHDSETVVELAELAGADACLSKRCSKEELQRAISLVLKLKRESPPSAKHDVSRTRKYSSVRLVDPT